MIIPKTVLIDPFAIADYLSVNEVASNVFLSTDVMRDTEDLDMGKVSLNPSIDSSTAQKKAIEFLDTAD